MKREDFPFLVNHPELIYLDSACTSLKPEKVIDAETSYYREYGACAGRSSHSFGRKTNEKLEECREKIAGFVSAEKEGLVWTRNTTEALNLLATSFDFSKKKKVVSTIMEHHAVLLPLMRLRDKGVIQLEAIGCDENGEVPLEKWSEAIDRETALVVTNNGNNTTGYRQDTKSIGKIAHDNGALICVDGAQGVAHHKVDFKKEDIDFLCFSAHKMLGPTGVGAFVAKKELLENMEPFIVGGGIVKTLTLEDAEYMPHYSRFEAGIQDYGGILGFAAACDYLKMETVEENERKLGDALAEQIREAGARIYGRRGDGYAALCSFNFEKAKPHDVALMLDKENIAVRSGFFCAQPAMEAMGAKEGAVRASCYIYNSMDDMKKFGEALQKIKVLYD
jgi:cysteine desulfurase/selenocysteine lyase